MGNKNSQSATENLCSGRQVTNAEDFDEENPCSGPQAANAEGFDVDENGFPSQINELVVRVHELEREHSDSQEKLEESKKRFVELTESCNFKLQQDEIRLNERLQEELSSFRYVFLLSNRAFSLVDERILLIRRQTDSTNQVKLQVINNLLLCRRLEI